MIALLEEAICVLDEEPAHYECGLCWAISVACANLMTIENNHALDSAESFLYRLIRTILGGPYNYVSDWLFRTQGVRLTDEELKDYRIRWATAILKQAKRERDALRVASKRKRDE